MWGLLRIRVSAGFQMFLGIGEVRLDSHPSQ
jgi:hypothetical protein